METSELKYGRQAVASCWNYCIWKTIDSNRNTWTWFRCLCSQSPEESKLQLVILYPYRDGREEMTVQILTLFRLGFFGQSVTGRGGSLDPPPLCISGTNNARVMKFTHNDHVRTNPQFWLATPNDDVTVTSYSDFSMFLIIFPLRYVKYQ